ncbi:MAG: helix-turn-helix domain-containing protein [Caldisphaeraceae archaeon]|nr:helix-turn-helix domain-containing protein [Desulfurococcales archaeon]MEB3797581.1 helix-turn-helix domain-containing protein [Caldisphaeraceae archaeon]
MSADSLTKEQRRDILRRLSEGKFVVELAKELGISRASLYRYIRGERNIPPELDPKLCDMIDEDELLSLLNNKQLLESLGVLKNGEINIPLVLSIIATVLEHPQAKDVILKRISTRYKTELQELLSTTLPRIELKWNVEFEKYLTDKKSKPISERTLRDYKNIWNLCLEGKTLGWHLLKQLEGKRMKCGDGEYHPTNWPRQIFRHYVRYLYSQGKLDWDTYTRLLLSVPGRKYGRKVNQKVIEKEDVITTLKLLHEERKDIYMLYLLILFSGVRFEHLLFTLKNWRPDEKLYVSFLNRPVKRLECFNSFCRYYAGIIHARKRAVFAYFPTYLIPYINEYRDKIPSKRRIEKVVKKKGGLMPSLIRTYALREMKAVIKDEDVYKFMIGKLSELTVTARHYLDLLSEADNAYPQYIKYLEEVMGDAVKVS